MILVLVQLSLPVLAGYGIMKSFLRNILTKVISILKDSALFICWNVFIISVLVNNKGIVQPVYYKER
ncbi:MAG: hypothetical protein IPI19_18890 [Ignavibacteriales bacterium]|nr:hypothetical protein [Ignavibacteriales bacterium]